MIIKQISLPKAQVRAKPGLKFELTNELLFGEKVKIQRDIGDWVLCSAAHDNYLGWIEKKGLTDVLETNYRVISLRSFVYEKDDIKGNTIFHLSLGSKISVTSKKKVWSKIKFINNNEVKTGFVPSRDIIKINESITNWVNTAEKFINTPYKWGGRDSQGIDCSALIQLSLETAGLNFPRDTIDQYRKIEIVNNDIKDRGSLIYWDGHVGVMTNKNKILHANAFHMTVLKEPLVDVIKRSEKEGKKILKIVKLGRKEILNKLQD